jgi:hypothetical protein
MCTTPTGALEALTCLPPLQLVVHVETNQLRIDAGVWNVGLTFTPSRTRSIDAASEAGSHV